MMYEQLISKIAGAVEKNLPEMISYNDETAEHPEVSGHEYETAKRIASLLSGHGYTLEYPFAGIDTAFRAVYGENNHKYKVGFLVEYDALPEIGHACGHCLSGAISILAGLSVKDLQDQLDTDFHIIGTPDEEDEGQKCHMAEDGVFDDYDMVLMIHLYNRNIVEPTLQCCLIRDYHFYGKASHASAAPWEGRNALNAAQLFLHAIDMLRQHTTVDAQFHGVISHGGDFPNTVPDHVVVKQMIRALDKTYVHQLDGFVDDCAGGAAMATQTTWKKEKCGEDYYNLKINETGADAIGEVFAEFGLKAEDDQVGIFGSSDIGNVSFHCPSFQPCLKIADENVVLHSREFAQLMTTETAHQTLALGAKVLANTAAKIFSDEEKVAAMKRDFLEG
ncbi:amidohydrolase [Ihubacter sp. mB4P-1]|uniref:amidohydrolase n=1 Tax=Ihubacter sp. mB4P-1 TaxID=3242370 RepID=UPI003C7A970E